MGSGLTSLTVLLDEPTRGMHPREVDGLIAALTDMRDEGNTVVVVEWAERWEDLNTHADFIIIMAYGSNETERVIEFDSSVPGIN